MKNKIFYTTKLQAGLGLINETLTLLDLWQPGMKTPGLFQKALDSGQFPSVSARRLRNIVSECFAPRYLISQDYPADFLKKIIKNLSPGELAQILFLFTARANLILADFIKNVYWHRYSAGYDSISSDEAKAFVIEANQLGKTARPWSEGTIQRAAGYLTGCCADFGLLEHGRRSSRKIIPFRAEQSIIAFLAYDLHFAGLGDNSIAEHPDWKLFGLKQEDLIYEMKQLALKNFLIIQTAGNAVHISWNYKNREDMADAVFGC